VEADPNEVEYSAGVRGDVVYSETAREATTERIDGAAHADIKISRWCRNNAVTIFHAGHYTRFCGGRGYRRRRSGLGAVPAPSVKTTCVIVIATPNYHFIASPDCSMVISRSRRVENAGRRPSVRIGIIPSTSIQRRNRYRCRRRRRARSRVEVVSRSGVQLGPLTQATPNNHFTTRPDCRVPEAGFRRVNDTGRRPTIRDGIISPTGVGIDEP
jgi:hypothetical protein